jgi:hypothetical protein
VFGIFIMMNLKNIISFTNKRTPNPNPNLWVCCKFVTILSAFIM